MQLASLTACSRSLGEPEDEILTLDGLASATDEVAKAQSLVSDPRVERLRSHLFEGIKTLAVAFKGDTDISQALSDFLKACTATNVATPLSLDAVALSDLLSYLIEESLDPIWLSIAGLLLFRARNKKLSAVQQGVIQNAMGRVLQAGTVALQASGGRDQMISRSRASLKLNLDCIRQPWSLILT